jgi:hypothetical protein
VVTQVEEHEPGSLQEAQGNSTGALPAPSREVPDAEGEEDDDDTDEIYFLAHKYQDVEPGRTDEREGMVHTETRGEDSEDTRTSLGIIRDPHAGTYQKTSAQIR